MPYMDDLVMDELVDTDTCDEILEAILDEAIEVVRVLDAGESFSTKRRRSINPTS
jgi:hypothetical protein